MGLCATDSYNPSVLSVEDLRQTLWSGPLHRTLARWETTLDAQEGPTSQLRPQVLRRPALQEAVAAWSAEEDSEVAEARRLCYVASTRARDELEPIPRSLEEGQPLPS